MSMTSKFSFGLLIGYIVLLLYVSHLYIFNYTYLLFVNIYISTNIVFYYGLFEINQICTSSLSIIVKFNRNLLFRYFCIGCFGLQRFLTTI